MLNRASVGIDASEPSAPGDTGAGPGWSWRADRAWRIAIAILVLVAVAGQVRVWASDRGFWNDELYIAVNLHRSFGGLWGSLTYLQVAPPGWLMGEKALLQVFGPGEQVLKLPQLLATMLLLGLTVFVARRAIGRVGALLATGVVVLSPLVFYYAGELKQYAVEAGLAMVIIAAVGVVGTIARRDGRVDRRTLLLFGGALLIAVAGSFSALIVLVGATAGLGLVLAIARRWGVLAPIAAAAGPAVGVGTFQILHRMSLGFMHNQDAFFPYGFPPLHAGLVGRVRWLPDLWHGLMIGPLTWRYPLVMALAVLAGLIALVVRGAGLWAAIIAGVFAAAVGAAAVRGLPLEGRVALYVVAPIAITVAAAADGAGRAAIGLWRRRGDGRGRLVVAVLSAVAVLAAGTAVALGIAPAAQAAYREVAQPLYRDQGRDMLRDVAAQLRPGDVVLAYYFSEPLATWYATMDHLPIVGLARLVGPAACRPDSLATALAGARRVWYVHGAQLSHDPADYTDRVLAQLDRRGTLVATSTHFASASWSLVDLTAGPDRHPPVVSADPTRTCLVVSPVPGVAAVARAGRGSGTPARVPLD